MTPSFIGLIATTLPGVRPSISFASRPTATTSPVFLLMATIDGSFTTMPLPLEKTSVFAVPKSIARSEENKLNTDLRLNPFLFMTLSPPRRKSLPRTGGIRPRPRDQRDLAAARPLLRYDDVHASRRRASPAVRSDHHNGMLARVELFSEMSEAAVRPDIRHRLAVHDERGARLGAPDDLHDMPVKLRALNLQRHLLGLALRHERELGRIAGIAGALLLIHCDNVPEIIAGLEPGDIDARPRNPRLLHCFREHRRGAYAQYIRNRLGDRFPFKMHCGLFRILHDERLQI